MMELGSECDPKAFVLFHWDEVGGEGLERSFRIQEMSERACMGDKILRTYAWMVYEFCTSYLSFGMLHCTFITQPMSMQMQKEEVGCTVH